MCVCEPTAEVRATYLRFRYNAAPDKGLAGVERTGDLSGSATAFCGTAVRAPVRRARMGDRLVSRNNIWRCFRPGGRRSNGDIAPTAGDRSCRHLEPLCSNDGAQRSKLEQVKYGKSVSGPGSEGAH